MCASKEEASASSFLFRLRHGSKPALGFYDNFFDFIVFVMTNPSSRLRIPRRVWGAIVINRREIIFDDEKYSNFLSPLSLCCVRNFKFKFSFLCFSRFHNLSWLLLFRFLSSPWSPEKRNRTSSATTKIKSEKRSEGEEAKIRFKVTFDSRRSHIIRHQSRPGLPRDG